MVDFPWAMLVYQRVSRKNSENMPLLRNVRVFLGPVSRIKPQTPKVVLERQLQAPGEGYRQHR